MKNLRLFKTVNEFGSDYYSNNYTEPWASYTLENSGVSFNKTDLDRPLRFEIISGGTIRWTAEYASSLKTISYSKNGGEWISITSNTGNSAPSISVNAGDIVEFVGDNANYGDAGSSITRYYNTFSGTTAKFELAGNIMSLINSTGFGTTTILTTKGTFCALFSSCTGLTSAERLLLPATTLSEACYKLMFMSCTNLIKGPALQAKTLAPGCYEYMYTGTNALPDTSHIDFTSPEDVASGVMMGLFSGTKVTDADLFNILPVQDGKYCLPVMTLEKLCYYYMFSNCVSLTTAPVLPAVTMKTSCYFGMFERCSNLINAPELPATTLADACYHLMFNGCTSLTTAPALPATSLTEGCYDTMFKGCTSLTTAPELPATMLTEECYRSMFSGCTNLNYIKCLATNISASNCTYEWVNGVASTGTFVKNPSITEQTWGRGATGIPSNWTVQDAQ